MYDHRRLLRFLLLCLALLPALRCVAPDSSLPYLCDDSDGGGCPEGSVCALAADDKMRCLKRGFDAAAPPSDAGALDAGALDATAAYGDAGPGEDAAVEGLDAAGPGKDAAVGSDAGAVDGGCGRGGSKCCGQEPFCEAGTVCSFQLCETCGANGQPCCAGDACEGRNTCLRGTCSSCGGPSAPCCGTGAPCDPGATCAGEKCVTCGTQGAPCCPGGTCTPAGLACGALGGCEACGKAGQPCCAPADAGTAARCDQPLRCLRGTCTACGVAGGSACGPGFDHFCDEGLELNAGGVCVPCGEVGQPCCRGGACTTANACCDAPATASGARLCVASMTPCPVFGGLCAAGFCGACAIPPNYDCCAFTPDGGTPMDFCNGEKGCSRGPEAGGYPKCLSCGHAGQPCCTGGACTDPFTQCDNGSCAACGQPTLAPAGKENICCRGTGCSSGCCTGSKCVPSGESCEPFGFCTASGLCTTCGGPVDACCGGEGSRFCLGAEQRCSTLVDPGGTCQ
ncbi:MAG TPA: hypothetical protein VGK67_24955 [Myxococcales bacterium]